MTRPNRAPAKLIGLLALVAGLAATGCRRPEDLAGKYNLGVIAPGKIFRSAIPDPELIRYLKREYGLRSVIYVHDDKKAEYLTEMAALTQELDIRLEARYSMKGHSPRNYEDVVAILRFIADPQNQPVLLHCHGGENRTGLIAAIIRKIQGWPERDIFMEYFRFNDDPEMTPTHGANVNWIIGFFRLRMQRVRDIHFPPAAPAPRQG